MEVGDGEVEADEECPPTALATNTTATASIIATAPEGCKEGDEIEVEGEMVRIPAGVLPGESFVVAQRAPVVAEPVRGLASPSNRASENAAELENLSVLEHKLLNYKWSTKCFAVFDASTTLLLALAGGWSVVAVFFLVGPLYGYVGAKHLSASKITTYLIVSLCKVAYVTLIAIFRAYLAFFILIIQIWLTYTLLRFRFVLAAVPPDRLAQLQFDNPPVQARWHFIYAA